MESDKIDKLLEKYFEAGTTAAEERELRDYFASGDVATHLQDYIPVFAYFSQARNERSTRQVPLKTRRSYFQWLSVAAAAVLLIGLYFGRTYQQQRQAEFAYEQTRKALGMIAQNLERGTEKVAYISAFDNTKQKIYKNN